MARHDRSPTDRPDRVVIVDADNPLREIHDEFVWRDDHERAVSEAHAAGYAAGHAAAQREAPQPDVAIRVVRRRSAASWMRLILLVALALLFILMVPILLF